MIPCYKVSKSIKGVIKNIPKFVDNVYLVDDKCPENSIKNFKTKSKKKKKFIETKMVESVLQLKMDINFL